MMFHISTKKQKDTAFTVSLVRPEGFEPPTFAFVVRDSIQLSYGRIARDTNIIIQQILAICQSKLYHYLNHHRVRKGIFKGGNQLWIN